MIRKKAAGYARYSSAHQRDESIVRQLEAIREFCQQSNLQLVHEYIDEAQSGTNDRREQFQKMMGDAMMGDWDFIVVYKLDRLSRSVADAMHYKKKLTQVGIRVLSVIEDFDESTPEGNFFNLITLGISEFYVKNLAREAFAGQMQNAKRAMSAGGPPPLGYQFDKDKRLVIEPYEAEAVKLMFALLIQDVSYRNIAKALNEKGYRTRYGNPFKRSLTLTLTNRKYIGEFVYNQKAGFNLDGSRNFNKLKPESEIVRIPNAVPRIIDDETFEKAQVIVAERMRTSHKTYMKGKYLLTGLVKCGVCLHRMSGHTNHGGKNKSVRVIYRCRTKVEGLNCTTKALNIRYLDAYVYKQLRALMHTQNRPKLLALLETLANAKQNELKKRMKDTQKRLDRTLKDREALKQMKATSRRSLERLLTEQVHDYDAELHRIQEELTHLKTDHDSLALINTKYIDTTLSTMKRRMIDKNTRKETVFQLVREIIVHNDVIHLVFLFNTLFEHYLVEEVLYRHTEKRENVAFKPNHDQWTTILT